jgi:Ca-activated chloride channel family protein
MKYAVIILALVINFNDPIKVRKINSYKSEAKKAFNAGDYKGAIQKYRYLVDSLGVIEDEVALNLANAYYLEKDTTNALNSYQSLTASTKKEINSKAHQQLGLMANSKGKSEEALNYFKQAVKADPTNESARYNYEMLKKKLEEKKKQDQKNKDQKQNKDQKNKDQQNKDQQNKDKQDQKDKEDKEKKDQENKDEQKKDQQNKDDKEKKDQKDKDQQQKDKEEKEKKDQQEKQEKEQKEKDQKNEKKENQNLDRDKLDQMKISEEKAKMILEAMKNQEKQYLQQQKRRSTKSKDRTKPDW